MFWHNQIRNFGCHFMSGGWNGLANQLTFPKMFLETNDSDLDECKLLNHGVDFNQSVDERILTMKLKKVLRGKRLE